MHSRKNLRNLPNEKSVLVQDPFELNRLGEYDEYIKWLNTRFSLRIVRAATSIVATICFGAFATSCSLVPQGGSQGGLKALRRIDHLALNVNSLERSAGFYNTVFGFSVVNKWKGVWMVGNDRMRIGLFEHPKATAITKPEDLLVIAHVAFLTDEHGFAASVQEIDRLGLPHEPVEDTGIAKSVFIHDPDGHELEITYYYQKQPTL